MDRPLQEFVWRRANANCEYCHVPQSCDALAFEIDHIIGLQHLGSTSDDNLALACYACNHHKGPNIAGFDVVTEQIVALFHPRRDNWSEHFRWSGPTLEGLTPAGRVTVHVLSINRDVRVALRRALILEGVLRVDNTGTEP